MWSINAARELAISELSCTVMQTMDRIILGKAYAVDDWVLSGYTEITKRDRPISPEEGKVLGGVAVALLSQVREAACKAASLKTFLPNYGYTRHIKQLFGSELTEKSFESSWKHPPVLLSVQEMLAIVHNKTKGLTRHNQFYLESVIFQVSKTAVLSSITP